MTVAVDDLFGHGNGHGYVHGDFIKRPYVTSALDETPEIALGYQDSMKASGFLKLFLSALMLWLVIRAVQTRNLQEVFLSIPLDTAFFVVAGYVCGQLLSATKWWIIARSSGIDAPFKTALKAYYIGMFVNCFGLGMVGGDLARGLLIAQNSPKKAEGIATVIADRIHGLGVLAWIGMIAALSTGVLSDRYTYALVLISFAITLGWFLGPWVLDKFADFLPRKFADKAHMIAQAFPRKKRVFILISGISFVFHLSQIALHIGMANGVGAWIPFPLLLSAIPLVNIASSLPISWLGLGVREKAYTLFLVPAVMSTEQALVMGALWLLALTVTSAIGGLIALWSGDLVTLKSAKAEYQASKVSQKQTRTHVV